MIETVEEKKKRGSKLALARVIRVIGSAYRREGAMMLIDDQGQTMGMISGGCLEPDVAQTALQVMKEGAFLIKSYTLDEDLMWGLGLGCPGTVEVLIESLPLSDPPLDAWLNGMKEEQAGVLITTLDREEGGRLYVSDSGEEPVGSLGNPHFDTLAVKYARNKLGEQNPKSESRMMGPEKGREARLFFDVYQPPVKLLIFGAGHDAIPLAAMGHSLGFQTIVVDPRLDYNTPFRFPHAKRILAHPPSFAAKVKVDPQTYAIIMNHHLERDMESLHYILQSKAAYIGVLGPLSRRNGMLDRLKQEGKWSAPERLKHMFSPVGLDIGAYTPEEIAVSILSEIVAVRNRHSGGFLRDRARIHHPSSKEEHTA